MSASSKIKAYLENEKISYQILEHDPAYSAMEIAGSQHIPGRQFVKTVIVNGDGKFIMCILPAIHLIDLEKLKSLLKVQEIRLASEQEVARLFPDYEVGAEPPFGEHYGLKVYLDKILEENEEIAFNAGTHTDIMKIKFRDFIRLAKPTIAEFGTHIQTRATSK